MAGLKFTKGDSMKRLAAFVFLCGLVTSSFAIGVGKFKVNPEIGGSVGLSTRTDTMFAGGYARVWLGGDGLTIAPMFKYNYIFGPENTDGFSIIQAGGLIGYRILRFTPYIGASYSLFQDRIGLNDTTALNYGVYFDIPLLPLSVGFDASWQKPKIVGTDSRVSQHQFAITLGLIF